MAGLAPREGSDERAAFCLGVFDVLAHNLRRGSPEQLALQQPALEHQPAPVIKRASMINHRYGAAPAPQHSMRFPDGSLYIGRVMEHAKRVDCIEALV